MRPPLVRQSFVVVVSVSLVALVLFLSYSGSELAATTDHPSRPLRWVVERRGFLLNTPGCQVPDWDPYDPSVLPFVEKIREPYKCPGRPPLIKPRAQDAALELQDDLVGLYYGVGKDNVSCSYRPILRDPGPEGERTDNRFLLGPPRPLEFGVPLADEFLSVDCKIDGASGASFSQFVPLAPLKPAVERRRAALARESGGPAPLSVLLVGIDSVSRLNFLRHFPKTRAAIAGARHARAFELRGYTKVADNTFPNLVPLLTGHFVEHYWNESLRAEMFFDGLDFVWKAFAARGHRTLFAEDAPGIATFNYLKKGFRDPPADYYFRPFALAVEKSAQRRDSRRHCLQSVLEMDLLHGYLSDFVRAMGARRPHFAFEFVARLTHDALNAAAHADEPTARLLRRLGAAGAFNRSLVLLFSDHGIRFGPIRQTYVGKIEERMPFAFLLVPRWFLARHPAAGRRLRENRDRLTTPFDVHATLVHLLRLGRSPSSKEEGQKEQEDLPTPHGLSLMGPIPKNRTCEDASILPHWCPCQASRPVDAADPVVVNCAASLVDTLNQLLRPLARSCVQLRLKQVLSARVAQANDAVLRFVRHQNDVIDRRVVLGEKVSAPLDYSLVVEVDPSRAVLEGTVRYSRETQGETYRVLDDVSRLNKYGNQSACIDNARLRKFCYCKRL